MIQIVEGTALYFSTGCVAFILIAAFAFNLAGGLSRASGAHVFSYAVLVVLIGICYKAYLGEPADSNLLSPKRTIELYDASITAMLAAVIVSRRFSRKTGLLQDMLQESKMYRSSVGCIVFGAVGGFALALLGQSAVRLQTAFVQLNELIPLGIIIGAMYEIRRSGGRRSINLPLVLGGIYYFVISVTGFGKQGMLTPLYCWLLPVCALRYRLSSVQIASILVTAFLIFHYLVPFSQYGRNLPGQNATFSDRMAIAIPLLLHPEDTRQKYLDSLEDQTIGVGEGLGEYYNKPQGFWDRLQFVSGDDSLINFTDQGHVFGLLPVQMEFMNVVPRVFWPNKPDINLGNVYAHEMGGVVYEEDTSTGISFSPTSEAYHLAKWTGVLVIAPLLWFLMFVMYDSLFGDLRAAPWGLLALAMISHTAPEGGITGVVYLFTFGVEIFAFCAFFATWVAPILAIPVLGPDRGKWWSRTCEQSDPPSSPFARPMIALRRG